MAWSKLLVAEVILRCREASQVPLRNLRLLLAKITAVAPLPALKPLAEIQDMTSAYVRWKQVTDEPQYRPAAFGRYSRRRW